MSFMIKSQQPGHSPLVESGRHASGFWYVQCGQPAILVSFVGVDKTVTKEETVVHLHKTKRVKDNLIMDKIIIGDLLLDVKVVKIWRKESSIIFWEDCMHKINVVRRTRYGCNSCKENHPSNECRQLDKIINMPNPIYNNKQGTT